MVAAADGASAVTHLRSLWNIAGTDPVRGWWHFDETSGSVAHDSSGRGNDGALHGAMVGLPGYDGTSYAFANNAWVEVPASESLNPGTEDFYLSARVNFTVAPGPDETYDIIRKGRFATDGGEYKLEIVSGGRVRCTARDSDGVAGAVYGPKTNLADGNWHLIGCRLTGSKFSVGADNVVWSKSVPFGWIGNSKALSIGSKYGEEDGVPGRIDEVRLEIS